MAGVSIQINERAPLPVVDDQHMILKPGDVLRLVKLRYCTSSEALADAVTGEAYFVADSVLAYDNALFIRSGPRVYAGCGTVGDFAGSWVVESGRHRVVIALIHYFGDSYEVDDYFYLNLDVQP